MNMKWEFFKKNTVEKAAIITTFTNICEEDQQLTELIFDTNINLKL